MPKFEPIRSEDVDYARRINEETGKMESICRYCYQTIAASNNSAVLNLAERQHDCPGKHDAKQSA